MVRVLGWNTDYSGLIIYRQIVYPFSQKKMGFLNYCIFKCHQSEIICQPIFNES